MYTQYYYRRKEDNTICLLRCYGESGVVAVPEMIDGFKVTEIGPYCFSQNSHLQGQAYEKTESPEEEIYMTEQAGRFITRVFLPPTVSQIGSYAFYNCRSLKELSFSASLKEIGNDTFMNCTSLHKLNVYGDYSGKTCLPFVLVQISWDIEISFLPLLTETEGKAEAVLFYPEYMEYYEELGPAHVFEIQVSGEGYRARKCFQDGILLFREYDGIFAKACSEENENTLCGMAMDRILYPAELTDENKERYSNYLTEHGHAAARMVFLNEEQELTERLGKLRRLLEEKILSASVLEELLVLSAERSMPEATATFISWKREFFAGKKKKRYEF